MRVGLLIVLLSLAGPLPAQAGIAIAPGVYEVPALLRVSSGTSLEAVFNLRSNAECRIVLEGKEAEKLRFRGMRGRLVKIKVTEPIRGGGGRATLLGTSELWGRAIPLQVGNDLAPEGP